MARRQKLSELWMLCILMLVLGGVSGNDNHQNIFVKHSIGDGQPANEEEGETIGLWEIRRVGSPDSTGPPMAKLSSSDPFIGYIFFEAHEDQLSSSRNMVVVDIYTNAANGEGCDSGTLLEGLFEVNSFRYDSYTTEYAESNVDENNQSMYPSTNNGLIGAAEFSILDYFVPSGDQQIYFPNSDGGEDSIGSLSVCVRLSYQHKGVPITVMDTLYTIDINFAGEFMSSTIQTALASSSSLVAAPMVGIVPVSAFLCDKNNEIISDDFRYKNGMDIRICVEPASNTIYTNNGNEFAVTNVAVRGFVFITCHNDMDTRDIIRDNEPDSLTSIEIDNDSGMAIVQTVVTAGFTDSATEAFQCYGQTLVTFDNSQGVSRRLTASFETRNLNNDIHEAAGNFSQEILLVGSNNVISILLWGILGMILALVFVGVGMLHLVKVLRSKHKEEEIKLEQKTLEQKTMEQRAVIQGSTPPGCGSIRSFSRTGMDGAVYKSMPKTSSKYPSKKPSNSFDGSRHSNHTSRTTSTRSSVSMRSIELESGSFTIDLESDTQRTEG